MRKQEVMKEGCTLGVQRQVFGAVRTLEHLGVLDLLHQLLQEVLPGRVSVQEAAGKRGPSVVCEPAQKVNVLRAGLKRPRYPAQVLGGTVVASPDAQSACGVEVGPPHQFHPSSQSLIPKHLHLDSEGAELRDQRLEELLR